MISETLLDLIGLPVVGPGSAREYGARRAELNARVDGVLSGHAEIRQLIGGNPLAMMFENHRNHVDFMANVLLLSNNELLARTLPWVYRAYRGRGFSFDYFPIALRAWIEAVEATLSPTAAQEVSGVYEWMLSQHERLVELAGQDCASHDDDRGHATAGARSHMLATALAGDSSEALRIADDAVHDAAQLADFYLGVLQPCLVQVGDLWEHGRISVAREHLASAVVTRVMTNLYVKQLGVGRTRGEVVVTAAPNEFHEIGARMVADLLEAEGWNARYLGSNTPAADVLALLRETGAPLLAISCCMPFNLNSVSDLIAAVRLDSACGGVRIMVGGRAFTMLPSLWRDVGADGWAVDAREAAALAQTWRTEWQRP